MSIKTVSIIGLGALGLLFGEKMASQLPPGAFRAILSPERKQRYERDGLFVNGRPCNFSYILPGEDLPVADLVLFAVKYPQLAGAIKEAHSQVGENTMILSLLNGIQSEEDLAQAFGREKVLYCVAQGMDAVKTGNRLEYTRPGKLCLGEDNNVISPRLEGLCRFFSACGIDWEIPKDIHKHLWSKFMFNVGVNQVSALFRGDYGMMQQEGVPRQVMLDAMKEVLPIAQKKGISLKEEDIGYWMEVLASLSPGGKTSMAQDVDARRLSELDCFSGTVLALGRETGCPCPVNERIYRAISDLEASYS